MTQDIYDAKDGVTYQSNKIMMRMLTLMIKSASDFETGNSDDSSDDGLVAEVIKDEFLFSVQGIVLYTKLRHHLQLDMTVHIYMSLCALNCFTEPIKLENTYSVTIDYAHVGKGGCGKTAVS